MTPFDRLGRFVVRRARLVIGAWAVLIAVALPLAPQAPGALSAGGFISDDLESARAKAVLEAELGTPPSALVVVFSSPELEAGTPEFELAAAAAMRDIPSAQHVAGVVSHLLQPRQISADRHTAYDIVLLNLSADYALAPGLVLAGDVSVFDNDQAGDVDTGTGDTGWTAVGSFRLAF